MKIRNIYYPFYKMMLFDKFLINIYNFPIKTNGGTSIRCLRVDNDNHLITVQLE